MSPEPEGGGISSSVTTDEEIYEKHAGELIRFATALVGADAAPDVLAEAVVGAITSRSWPHVVNPRAYLYRSVMNRARMWHRSEGRRSARERRSGFPTIVDPPDPRPEVLRAVRELSPQQRAVIFLAYWEDLDPPAVAARLGISDGSARRHLARARAKLRGMLADD